MNEWGWVHSSLSSVGNGTRNEILIDHVLLVQSSIGDGEAVVRAVAAAARVG